MFAFKLLLLCALHFARLTTASSLIPRALNLPPVGTVVDYGSSYDPAFPNMYRDGGGGITVNGKNLMVFSDTYTTNGGINGSWTSFTANTYAYAGMTASDPLRMQDFGRNGIPQQAVPMLANETYKGTDGRYCIWPSSSLVPWKGANGITYAIGVFPMITNLVGGVMTGMYSTMVAIRTDATNTTTTRVVPRLFYSNEIHYGSFGLLNAFGFTYLFAEDTTGIKAARVLQKNVAKRQFYQYFNGKTWASTPPAATDATANIFSFQANYFGILVGPSSGEFFYSPYHGTYLIVFMDGFVDGVFQVAYSLSGYLVGPWSEPHVLYQPPWPPQSWNYAGHAYPGMDPSGRTLTLSYTYGGNYINIAKVTWCDPADPTCVPPYPISTSASSSSASATSTDASTSTDISTSTTSSDTSTPATTSTSSTPPTPTAPAPLTRRKLTKAAHNPLPLQKWYEQNGPCKLKYNGCNVIPEKIAAGSNEVLEARVINKGVRPLRGERGR